MCNHYHRKTIIKNSSEIFESVKTKNGPKSA